MTRDVDDYDRSSEPCDRFHPDYESFSEWLNAEAPAVNENNIRTSKWVGVNQQIRLADLVRRPE